jgi:hypothetical protein
MVKSPRFKTNGHGCVQVAFLAGPEKDGKNGSLFLFA